MHDISLKPKDGKSITSNGALELSGTVKTYRYLDDKEIEEQEKAAAQAQAGAKPAAAAPAPHGGQP